MNRGSRSRRWWRGLRLSALAAIALALPTFNLTGAGAASSSTQESVAADSKAVDRGARLAHARLPLAFIPNAGQTDPRVRFSAQAGGASFFFTQNEAVLSFTKGKKGVVVRLAFLGANRAVRIEGRGRGPGRVNYFLGNDSSRWRTNLLTYDEVVYRELWPGIDMVVRGDRGALKYEFALAPGARVSDIRLTYRGADSLSLGPAGELLIKTPLGRLRDDRPRSYQVIEGTQVAVESRFVLDRGSSAYGFALDAYDSRRPLVIDPGLIYSTFLGGSGGDFGREIAIDANGSAYLTGTTSSSNFPTTAGAFQSALAGSGDVFVTKLNANGSALTYSSYLGGSGGNDESFGIAVDASGSAYVTGQTDSMGFPITPGAFQTTSGGGPPIGNEAFVTKLNASGSALVYSSYLGGNQVDEGLGIVVDAAGSAYVVGQTSSFFRPQDCFGCVVFPTTPGAFQTTPGGGFGINGFNCGFDAFLTKVNASGSALIYSSFLGGCGTDRGFDIAIDADGAAYLAGATGSSNFPTTAGAFQTVFAGGFPGDAFVTKVNAAGSALVYSSYLGGSSDDTGFLGPSIAVDAGGSAYLTGVTRSADFPTKPGAFQTAFGGGFDAFVTKVSAGGSELAYSSYLGGTGGDTGLDVAVGADGSAHVTGGTGGGFPVTPGAFQMTFGGVGDAFVARVNASGTVLSYSSYLGGCSGDTANGIAVDAFGTAYLGGGTSSTNFPTLAAFQPAFAGDGDAFVTKLNLDPVAQPFAPACGTIIVRKQTRPAFSSQSFAFTASFSATGFSLSDGQSRSSGSIPAGTYSVTEAQVARWDTTASCDNGDNPSAITLAAGQTVTCTFVNTQRGAVDLVKTVNGAVPTGGQSFTFQLRQGASPTSAGTILSQGTATAAAPSFSFLGVVPETTLALCEIVMPGWTTTLGPPLYVVYNPSGDNSTVCTDFTLSPGQRKSFAIDNRPPPGGLARTIGFWKNWASCAQSSGKQKPVLDQTLALAEPTGVQIGDLVLHAGDCLKAVRILNKSTINSGTKKASDPAFNLAAQLLAAKLNVVAGAGTCPAAVTAINSAQALLDAINFNGISHATMTTAQKNQANSLATTLDRYNNNVLC